MTSPSENDNDSYEGLLTPIEKYIYQRARRKPDIPFSFRDFTNKYKHGTLRNAFCSLRKKGIIRLYCRGFLAFYILSSSKSEFPPPKVTASHMVGRRGVRELRFDFGGFLDSLCWEEVCRVHCIVLCFEVNGLYDLLLEHEIGSLAKRSRDIQFGSFAFSRGRTLMLTVHKGDKVSARLKCSECPLEVSLDGLARLLTFLGGIRIRLTNTIISLDSSMNELLVPDACDWIVVQWHYGRDGTCEISGPAFNVTFRTWFKELARIYMRHCGRQMKPRLEVIETPRKSLVEAFGEKIRPYYQT
jgi:hypothetical protein